MLRRAAPRVIAVLVLLAMGGVHVALPTGWVSLLVQAVLSVSVLIVVSGPRQWWQQVRHGKPAPWLVEHGGATALFVIDPGRARFEVITRLQEHGALTLAEATRRADDRARPVWDDLTSESAARIGAILTEAGATVRVGPRPSPSWARDVTNPRQ
jgi:hypothetical protein